MTLRTRACWAILVASVALCFGAGACDGDGNPQVAHPSGGSGGGGGSGGTAGAAGSSAGDGAGGGATDAPVSDAPLSPVRVGIVPVPPSQDGGSTAADEKLALLETLAAGSRGVSVVRRWGALYAKPAEPVADAWTKLHDISTLFHDSGKSLLFSLALTDRSQDARPAGSPAGWNVPATRAALDAAVDQVFATFGDELVALSFGNEVDRYLAKASVADRTDLIALIGHALDYARNHPSRPPATVVGVSIGSEALGAGDADAVGLVAASDVAVLSYHPLDASFQARAPSTVAADLDLMSDALSADAGEAGDAGPSKPIFLQEVGYPSAAESASSPEQQSAFYQSLFQALSVRRSRFPFVCVHGLYDAPAPSCAAEATAIGAPGNAAAIAALCTLGLRTSDGSAKPAHASVLSGLAAFSKP